ncbi:TIGR04282 family arsenosugar biosynthesis glycosyltransferase [Dyadobacter sp. 3J3]|uniref:TIGR04282 family arsenosugar biosynthesis glycosyltransferase n=1 Tax=Dyadobacter sp. 3J3 TaxID=2606600 RepID=UPI00190F3DD5|nr:TIGR04282 family arsenosugar biosynthesis glycosyltransferase [Dyadobacter sp. 3J3]
MAVPQAQVRAVAVIQSSILFMKKSVIVFLKNLTLGRVKTRLAATIGDHKALEIYGRLVTHTLRQINESANTTFLYFSDTLDSDLPVIEHPFNIRLQNGEHLGERMSNAFKEVFETSEQKIVIIGTDCPGLDASIISEAMKALDENEVVIGPAMDGGYYLLGMKHFQPFLFEDIPWSTEQVLELTLQKCRQHHLTYCLLKTLTDIDNENDLNMWNSSKGTEQL